jgi:hypothetical protein
MQHRIIRRFARLATWTHFLWPNSAVGAVTVHVQRADKPGLAGDENLEFL